MSEANRGTLISGISKPTSTTPAIGFGKILAKSPIGVKTTLYNGRNRLVTGLVLDGYTESGRVVNGG